MTRFGARAGAGVRRRGAVSGWNRLHILLPVLLAACSGDSSPAARALDRWEAGREALEEGSPHQALRHFERARELDPESPALAGWTARALAATGALEEAVAVLDEAVRLGNAPPELVYNRAAYRSRLGREQAALDDLALVLPGRPTWYEQALADPDFQALVAAGRLESFAPASQVEATVQGSVESLLLGDSLDLELDVRASSPVRLDLSWEGGSDAGSWALLRIVDDRSASPGGAASPSSPRAGPSTPAVRRTVVFTIRALSAGEGELGPWRLEARNPHREDRAGVAIDLDPVSWRVLAPSGGRPPEGEPVPLSEAFWLPREPLLALDVPAATPRDGWLLVRHEPGDRVEVSEEAVWGPPVRLQVREAGETVAHGVAWRWRSAAAGAQIRVRRNGRLRLDARVEP